MRVTSGTNLMMRLMGNGALKYSCRVSRHCWFLRIETGKIDPLFVSLDPWDNDELSVC